ncbi:MAG: Dabb family protein, partial [Hydrogenimonas sp.]|nr:Dabb family protein [Hydrogenimonas sp.]
MFRFKELNRSENIERVKQMLESLPDKIEALCSMEVGVDFLGSERSM